MNGVMRGSEYGGHSYWTRVCGRRLHDYERTKGAMWLGFRLICEGCISEGA